jgi:hypothetical protein
MTSSESKLFSNIAATTAAFALKGGRYVMSATATWGGGNITLQTLLPDGTTYVSPFSIAGTANVLSADGSTTIDCPPGQYKIKVTTASGIYASLASIPN